MSAIYQELLFFIFGLTRVGYKPLKDPAYPCCNPSENLKWKT